MILYDHMYEFTCVLRLCFPVIVAMLPNGIIIQPQAYTLRHVRFIEDQPTGHPSMLVMLHRIFVIATPRAYTHTHTHRTILNAFRWINIIETNLHRRCGNDAAKRIEAFSVLMQEE